MKTDNGPLFNGHMWKSFLTECGIHHRKITPLWPQANAQAECFNNPQMNALVAASTDGLAWRIDMQRMLRGYRTKPHVTTAFTPHRIMFGRDPRAKLPEAVQEPNPDDQVVRVNDRAAKGNMTFSADTTEMAKASKTGKLSTPFHTRPLVVTLVTAHRKDGSLVKKTLH